MAANRVAVVEAIVLFVTSFCRQTNSAAYVAVSQLGHLELYLVCWFCTIFFVLRFCFFTTVTSFTSLLVGIVVERG